MFGRLEDVTLYGFSDSNWASSSDDMKSTSGYLFSLRSGYFSWNSKKQDVVVQPTAEVEYIAAVVAINQALWIRKILADLKFTQEDGTIMNVDNQAAIAISNNPVFHGKTKHFKIKYHFLREVQSSKEVVLVHCKTKDQLTDILTKALPKCRFEELREKIGVCIKRSKEECWRIASSDAGWKRTDFYTDQKSTKLH